MSLNNNQITSVLNSAIAQSTGASEVGNLDLQGIVDTGGDETIIGSKEQFTKSLMNVLVKNWFTDSSYRSNYDDPFFVDSREYGGIMQMVSVDMPTPEAALNWRQFANGDTIGTYKVYLPVVDTQYYGKTVSWQIPITITGEQWDSAFKSAEELSKFVGYIFVVVDNAIILHLEDMNNANRNNFMAEKINYAKNYPNVGVHVVNLVEEYVKSTGDSSIKSMTANEFLNSPKGLLFASEKMRLSKQYFKKMSTVFNTAKKNRFVPDDRMVFQVLSAFEEKLDTVALSNTFHKDIVEMPNYQSIAYWQGSGTDFGFEDVSKIDVTISSDGTKITQGGIVGFLCDKWAIMHTLIKDRVAVKHFDPENLDNYYYQFHESYANNLTMNALVFVVTDYTA